MGNLWLTSDWHFFHSQPFIYEPRNFKNTYEMSEAIIQRHNEVVKPDDEVYCLGDLMLNDNDAGIRAIKQLKGNIHIIRGNHDSLTRIDLYNECWNVVEITEGQYINYNNYHFYLSHYPCLCGNFDDNKSLKTKMINLCGHRHDKNKFCDMDKGIIYHCELDAHNCYPVNIETIIEDIKNFIKLSGQK